MIKEVKSDMKVSGLLKEDPSIAPILMALGMPFVSTNPVENETLEEAAAKHQLDCNDLVSKVNEYLSKKANESK